MVHFLGDASEISAVKIVIQNLSLGGRTPVYFFVPIFMYLIGRQFSCEVASSAFAKAVGENLVDDTAPSPVRSGEGVRHTTDLPQVSVLHVGVVSIFEQPESAGVSHNIEIVEEKTGVGKGKCAGKTVEKVLVAFSF